MGKKYISDVITKDVIASWQLDQLVAINSGTGTGKSYFILNTLSEYARENKKRILVLTNRKLLKAQYGDKIYQEQNMQVNTMTYQKLEYKVLHGYNKGVNPLDEYDFIVADEYHYWCLDSGYNNTTDISMNYVLKAKGIKILLSATGVNANRYIENYMKMPMTKYTIDSDYKHISSLNFCNKNETVKDIISDVLKNKEGEKIIYFCNNKELAYDTYKDFKKDAMFVCSKADPKYSGKMDEEKIKYLVKEEKFADKLLIGTTSIDNGINIIDRAVKHIIINVEDCDSLIQCLGRKRIIDKDDTITLYIMNHSNNKFSGRLNQANRKIERIRYLRDKGYKEYIKKYPRQMDYSGVLYQVNDTEEPIAINYVKYVSLLTNNVFYQEILMRGSKTAYKEYIANLLGIATFTTVEDEVVCDALNLYLEGMLGQVMLNVSDRKELIEKIDLKRDGKLIKKIGNLNGVLEEGGISYRIVEFTTSKMIDGKQKRYKSAWRVEKLTNTVTEI